MRPDLTRPDPETCAVSRTVEDVEQHGEDDGDDAGAEGVVMLGVERKLRDDGGDDKHADCLADSTPDEERPPAPTIDEEE